MLKLRGAIKGKTQMVSLLKRAVKGAPDEFGRALRQETEIEKTECVRVTPVDKGNLRGSIGVNGPFREGRRIWTEIYAGGIAAPYAVYVHENLYALHLVGGAKFIERPLFESKPFIAQRVARRIEMNRLVG